MSGLYYNMLSKAHGDGMKRIVLPPISTAIFTSTGTGFTKKALIAAIHEGMYQGIQKFLSDHPAGRSLSIILK